MTPQENLKLARAVLDAIGTQDAARLIELSDPDVEWHSIFAVGEEGGAYRGHEGARRYMSNLADVWDVGRADADEEDAIAIADIVLLVGHIRYRGKGSGAESESPVGWMLKFRNGKLLYFRAFRDPARALEAVGLSE